MVSTLSAGLFLAFVAAADAGVCRESPVRDSYTSCVARGCRWSGSCREPSPCDSGGTVRHRGPGGVENTGVRVVRAPMSPEEAALCDTYPICTARYSVTLSRKFTSGGPNCNDYGMLPPHGVNQEECEADDNWAGYKSQLHNYEHYPLPNDGVQQSIARSKNLVTALTLDTEDCHSGNVDCAFPYGYYSDILKSRHAICVTVNNVGSATDAEGTHWVEIMASAKGGSDGAFCAEDFDALAENQDPGCTKTGDLVLHREADSSTMNIMFRVEDNQDDANLEFYWRIAMSYSPSGKDAEDWSQFRDGAQFPLALMPAYPIGYDQPAVFEKVAGDSASWSSASFFVTLVLSVACAVVHL